MSPVDSIASLQDADLRKIEEVLEMLDRSGFDYLQLEIGNIRLTVGKGAPPDAAGRAEVRQSARRPAASAAARAEAAAGVTAMAAAPAVSTAEADTIGDTVPVRAPLTGMFYTRPDPTSDPFVTVGDHVEVTATVGLIEVMKVFNAVPADVAGTIVEICVDDAERVERGQTLFRIRPAEA